MLVGGETGPEVAPSEPDVIAAVGFEKVAWLIVSANCPRNSKFMRSDLDRTVVPPIKTNECQLGYGLNFQIYWARSPLRPTARQVIAWHNRPSPSLKRRHRHKQLFHRYLRHAPRR